MNPKITESELELFELLRQDKLKDYEVFSKKEYKNIFRGIIEKYPESAHFIYELIQNADDARATNVSIILYYDKLVFKHDGKKQFDVSDVRNRDSNIGDLNAILSACSNKEDDKETIGKFGVGFKSVFQYTNHPLIYDEKFWFEIEHYIIPNLLDEDYPGRKPNETVFVLPFFEKEKAYSEIKDRLNKLSLPVIFLNNVKKVEWAIVDENISHDYSKQIILNGTIHDIDYEYCKLMDGKDTKTMCLFHRNALTSEGKYKVSVGYFISDKGLIDTDVKPSIHCFFPTSEKFEGCFISNAPFLLTDNRDRILHGKVVNDEFIEAIAKLAVDSLLCLRDIDEKKKLINDNIFKMANIKDNSERNLFLKKCYIDVMKKEKIILSKSLQYDHLNALMYSSESFYTFFTYREVRALFDNRYVDLIYIDDYRADVSRIRKEYAVPVLDSYSLSNRLSSDYVENQEQDWIDKFIHFLSEEPAFWKKSTFVSYTEYPRVWFMPVVKVNNHWMKPYTKNGDDVHPNVFLPSEEGMVNSEEYKFVDVDFLNRHKDFLNKLEIRHPEMSDYINQEILPHYCCEEIPPLDTISSDFKFIYNMYKENRLNRKCVEILRDSYKLLCIHDGNRKMINVRESYIIDDDLEQFFSNYDEAYGIDMNFYTSIDNHFVIEDVSNFLFRELFVKKNPVVRIKRYYNYYYSDMPCQAQEFLNSIYLSCSRTAYFDDYILEGYNFSIYTEKLSKLLWKYICKIGNPDNYSEGKVKYVVYHGSNYKSEEIESSLFKKLREDKWICFDENNFCSPKDITVNDFWSLGYDKNDEWTSQLNFCQNRLDSIIHTREREELEKREQEVAQREKEQREREEKWQETNNRLCNTIAEKGYDVNKILESAISRIEQGLDPYENQYISEPDSSYSNDTSYRQLINSIGEENIELLAVNSNDVMEYIDRKYWYEPNNVRKIIHVIGCKIYEHYLKNNHFVYEKGDNSDCYDFKLESKYISVITTLKSIKNGDIPVGLTRSQNFQMRNNEGMQFRIVRISLEDICLIPSYNDFVSLHGKSIDITNERYIEKCEKIAECYWKNASVKEFDDVSPEYAIKIERKN